MKQSILLMVVLVGPIWLGCSALDSTEFFDLEWPISKVHEMRIERFVGRNFVGVPSFTEIKRLTSNPQERSQTVKKLSDQLNTECGNRLKGHTFCSKIATTLGMIGGDNSGKAIRKFLQEGEARDFRSKTDALVALGLWSHITEKMKNDKSVGEVLSGLISCVSASSFYYVLPLSKPEKQFGIECPLPLPQQQQQKIKTREERNLVRASIISLGVSGSRDPRVGGTLQALLSKAPDNTSYQALIIQAIRAHNHISANGLVCYYEREGRECQDKDEKSVP